MTTPSQAVHLDKAALTAYLQKKVTDCLAFADALPDQKDLATGAARAFKTALDNLDLFDIPTVQHDPKAEAKLNVRHRDHETSFEAATADSKSRQALYRAIYDALTTRGPLNDDELRNYFQAIGYMYGHDDSVSKRRGELVRAGWVAKTSKRRKSNVGHNMAVWTAVPGV